MWAVSQSWPVLLPERVTQGIHHPSWEGKEDPSSTCSVYNTEYLLWSNKTNSWPWSFQTTYKYIINSVRW